MCRVSLGGSERFEKFEKFEKFKKFRRSASSGRLSESSQTFRKLRAGAGNGASKPNNPFLFRLHFVAKSIGLAIRTSLQGDCRAPRSSRPSLAMTDPGSNDGFERGSQN